MQENKSQDKAKILVTGARGFVGARIMKKYPSAIATPSELTRSADQALAKFIEEYSPSLIINAAAISDIGECEKNPDASFLANVSLPVTLAKCSKRVGAKLISFSSDQVYTGCKTDGPYSEKDSLPTPKNVYATHKLEAEKRALDINPDTVMLRATWMYDMPIPNHANRGNFLVNTLNSVKNNAQMSYSSLTFRGITYVKQVVEFLDKVFTFKGGVYNYGSENTLDMFSTAKALVKELCGQEGNRLVIDSKEARHNLWMDCQKIREMGVSFDDTVDGVRRCVADYGLKIQ